MIVCRAQFRICLRLRRSQAVSRVTLIEDAGEQFILLLSDLKETAGAVMAVINREA